ncbi:hypothetical protein YC2023_094597 [Brassica napus]
MTDVINVYTDAVCLPQDNITGCGWHYTDFTPQKKNVRGQGSTVEAFVTSPLTAEALSVCEPLFQAKSLHFSNIWFKTDSQVLLNALLSKKNPTWFGIAGSKQIAKCSSTHSFQKKIPVELYRIHTDIETLA